MQGGLGRCAGSSISNRVSEALALGPGKAVQAGLSHSGMWKAGSSFLGQVLLDSHLEDGAGTTRF